MNNERLVDNIRFLCNEKNISINQLEKDLRFSVGSISRWEKSVPSIDKVESVSDYFHITIDELINYNNNINSLAYKESKFVNILIQKTYAHELEWQEATINKSICENRDFEEYDTNLLAFVQSLKYNRTFFIPYKTGCFYISHGIETFTNQEYMVMYTLPSRDSKFTLIKNVDTNIAFILFREILNYINRNSSNSLSLSLMDDFINENIDEDSYGLETNRELMKEYFESLIDKELMKEYFEKLTDEEYNKLRNTIQQCYDERMLDCNQYKPKKNNNKPSEIL